MYGISVYPKDREEESLVYNDWNRSWDQRKRYKRVMASIALSPKFHQDREPKSSPKGRQDTRRQKMHRGA